MTNNAFRLPAEWEHNEYVLLSWPHAETDWAYMLDEVRRCFIEIASSITLCADVIIVAPDIEEPRSIMASTPGYDKMHFLPMPTNDTWARDFGMICTISAEGEIEINDFKFNGWGLKFASCHDNLINRHILQQVNMGDKARYANRLNFVLEGGSIESDGCGTLLTTSNCLLSPNRNGASSKDEIESALLSIFGARKVLWADHGDLQGDDTDSHIDTLARILPGNIIACTTCDRPDDAHYTELDKMVEQIRTFTNADGVAYKIIELPIPEAIYDDDGMRLPATYANFLIINGKILLPVYADAHYDAIAIERMKTAMPGYDIIPIDCRALIQQHGSLHCMTMQIPSGAITL